ncbi:MAG: DUF4286 family protein [Cloacibacterium sp.]|jgi:hypothetical protein|nr:DUF4286 family protein [Cloacibacterium sp.]
MPILSITFHTEVSQLKQWEQYIQEELILMIENLMDVEKYILSAVHSEMISEGKNTNLLLVFDNEEIRMQFVESELLNITERIEKRFGESVMVFNTHLDEIKHSL